MQSLLRNYGDGKSSSDGQSSSSKDNDDDVDKEMMTAEVAPTQHKVSLEFS